MPYNETQNSEFAKADALRKLQEFSEADWVRQNPKAERLLEELKRECANYFSTPATAEAESSPHTESSHEQEVTSGESVNTKELRGDVLLKWDFVSRMLVPDSSGRGEMKLQNDGSGRSFLVPKVDRFQTKQDFFTYYERFFDCDNPRGGQVNVLEPAEVKQIKGGYELVSKGKLEIN